MIEVESRKAIAKKTHVNVIATIDAQDITETAIVLTEVNTQVTLQRGVIITTIGVRGILIIKMLSI